MIDKESIKEKRNNWLKEYKERTIFFLNLHNFTILYGLCKSSPSAFPCSEYDWDKYSRSINIMVAGQLFTPFEIKYFIVRAALCLPKNYDLSYGFPSYKLDDPKAELKCSKEEPLLNFGFYYPYKSNPFLKIFTPASFMSDLIKIARLCLVTSSYSNIKLILPGIMESYEEDFFESKMNKKFMSILQESLFYKTSLNFGAFIAKW